MKKILVPVDFSEYSYNACLFALEIANIFYSEIHLIHSYIERPIFADDSFSTGITSETLINHQFYDIEKNAATDLKELYETLSSQCKVKNIKNINIEYSLLSGEPENTIISFSKNYLPDLIIMGSRGKSKKGIFMGSVSKKIMCNSKIPVLAIPESYFLSKISNIMYITDFEETDELFIDRIVTLFKKLKIKIHCVHFNLKENKIVHNEKQMKNLKNAISSKYNKNNIEFELIDSSDITHDVEKFVSIKHIDLIAFHSHKRNIFKDIFTQKPTMKFLYKINIPLLSLNT